MDRILPRNTSRRKQFTVDVTVVNQGEVNVGSISALIVNRDHQFPQDSKRWG